MHQVLSTDVKKQNRPCPLLWGNSTYPENYEVPFEWASTSTWGLRREKPWKRWNLSWALKEAMEGWHTGTGMSPWVPCVPHGKQADLGLESRVHFVAGREMFYKPSRERNGSLKLFLVSVSMLSTHATFYRCFWRTILCYILLMGTKVIFSFFLRDWEK